MNAIVDAIDAAPRAEGAVASPLDEQVRFFEDILAEWLADPDTTVACGRWSEGAISEILPRGRAKLLPARYDGCFAGVRELRLDDGPHHLHIDLGRVHRVCYAIAPCVCFNFRPSFEVRFLTYGPGGAPSDQWVVSLMPSAPYHGQALRRPEVERFLQRASTHARSRPAAVEVVVDDSVRTGPQGGPLLGIVRDLVGARDADWSEALESLVGGPRDAPRVDTADPPCVALLADALALKDSSLVIHRDRTLIEFKTEKLDGVHRYVEAGHVSWQIGAFDDHHCHLALSSVVRVLFSAEPVSCQGGGLNYTAWFLTAGPCGNPYRRDGYFSVVLNRPYTGNQPRPEVIEPMFDLYRRYRHESWVAADETFLRALADGPPSRRPERAGGTTARIAAAGDPATGG